MSKNKTFLMVAIIFLCAGVLFGIAALLQTGTVVKWMLAVAAACELAAGFSFFCTYIKNKNHES